MNIFRFRSHPLSTTNALHFPILLPRHFYETPSSKKLKPAAPKRRLLRVQSSGQVIDGDGKRAVPIGLDWWSLPEREETQSCSAEPVRVSVAICRVWELVRGDRWILFVAFGALVVAAISEISMPALLTATIFAAQRGETVVFYRNSRILVLLFVISGICSGVRSGCFAAANAILVRRLREITYSVIVLQDISFFDRRSVGDLTSRLGADCQWLSNVIGNELNVILRNIFQGIGALANLLMLSRPLGLSAVALCSALSAIFLFYGRYRQRAAKLTQDFTAGANEVAQETLSSMRTVRISGAEEIEQARFKLWLDKIAFISLRESAAYVFWSVSFMTLYRLTQVTAVTFGGMSILSGDLSPEKLTKYVLYCEWLIYATWRVTDNVSSLMQSVGASEEIFHLLNLDQSSGILSKGKKMSRITGHIQFKNVSFCYPLRPKVMAIESVNLSIRANETIAIVGPSGSGKSTLISLLLRLYEPMSGQIYIDGFSLGELDIRWLREHIGFVEQEPHLFHMDIKSNIRYGCSRDIKQEDIESAARKAYAHDFISCLPDGYETIVDDKLLSGGQKQRIAIARAILRDPSILILDEATSALDSESEHYVKEVVNELKNDSKSKRTVIMIAHRFSTINSADRIIVMDGGRVIEMGNQAELIQRNGLYAKLIRAQKNSLA